MLLIYLSSHLQFARWTRPNLPPNLTHTDLIHSIHPIHPPNPFNHLLRLTYSIYPTASTYSTYSNSQIKTISFFRDIHYDVQPWEEVCLEPI